MVMDVLDRAIQIHGSLGMTDDTPLAALWRFSRMLRLADGPDEVHKMVLARRELNRWAKRAEAETEGIVDTTEAAVEQVEEITDAADEQVQAVSESDETAAEATAEDAAEEDCDQRVPQRERRDESRPRHDDEERDTEVAPEQAGVERSQDPKSLGNGLDSPAALDSLRCGHPYGEAIGRMER